MQSALEAALSALAWGPEPRFDSAASACAWFVRHGLEPADAHCMSELELDGWLLYRELAREKLASVFGEALPATAACLGARFERDVYEFLAQRGASSRLLHLVVADLVAFWVPRWSADETVPRYAAELAQYEALELELAAHPDRASEASDVELDLDLDAGLAFDTTCRLVRYRYAVHRSSDDARERSEPEQRNTTLLVFRDAAHEVRAFELDSATAALLEELLAGRSLGFCFGLAAREIRDAASFVSTCARLLAELSRQGAIVGPRAAVR